MAYLSKKIRKQLDAAAIQMLRFTLQMTWMKIPFSTLKCKSPKLMSGVLEQN